MGQDGVALVETLMLPVPSPTRAQARGPLLAAPEPWNAAAGLRLAPMAGLIVDEPIITIAGAGGGYGLYL